MKKIRLNDPCSCGSGKKYKNCCLKKQEAEELSIALGLITGMESLEEFNEYAAPLYALFGKIENGNELAIRIAMDCSQVAQTSESRRQAAIDDLMQKYKAEAEQVGIDTLTLAEALVMMITRHTKFFAKEEKKKKK
ncbi:MAG: SEC-C metal-binding domain-containing protein [bacterium]